MISKSKWASWPDLLTGISKVIGLVWYWFVVPFRRYSRSVVHSYCLSELNDTRIKRLDERRPEWSTERQGWILHPYGYHAHMIGHTGFVKKRKVSKLKFWLVVFLLWGWIDDDSVCDTFDDGHNRRYINGDLKRHPMAIIFRPDLIVANESQFYGNAFDLGDFRSENPQFFAASSLIWNTRNTAYNFNYLLRDV